MTNTEDVRKWYNAFTKNQLRTGVNLRHYKICNYLLKAGLKRNHRVLEIGCGIGTLTGLVGKYLRGGSMVATDISDQSIEIAKNTVGRRNNIEFVVTDMSNFEHPGQFDFVVLADVLEHIPIDQHDHLLSVIARSMHVAGRLIIHIPHPKAIEYLREHEPDKLQVIDQSIHADVFMKHAYAHNLLLVRYESYSLFNDNHDYVFIEMIPNQKVNYLGVRKAATIRRKLIERLKYFKLNLW